MLQQVIFIAIFICITASCNRLSRNPVDFKLCSDVIQTGILSNVLISECSTLPCTFKRGLNYSIEIDFENNRPTPTLTAEVYGYLQGVDVPFAWPGLDQDGCSHMLVGWCPLFLGDYVTYGMTMRVDPIFPSLDATMRWLLKGDDGRAIFCFELPVRLT